MYIGVSEIQYLQILGPPSWYKKYIYIEIKDKLEKKLV